MLSSTGRHVCYDKPLLIDLLLQLRGMAGKRQVDGAKVAIQHNLGLGGAAVVTIYRKYGS